MAEIVIETEGLPASDDTFCESPLKVAKTSISDSSTQTAGSYLMEAFNQPFFSICHFVDEPNTIHFYTGLESYDKFTFVLQTLGPAVYHLNYIYSNVTQLSVEDQFFMTMIKLRQHKVNFELNVLRV